MIFSFIFFFSVFADGRAVLPGRAWEIGRSGNVESQRQTQSSWPRKQFGSAQCGVRRERAHANRHDRALRLVTNFHQNNVKLIFGMQLFWFVVIKLVHISSNITTG